MIPITDLSWQGHSWQSLVSSAIRTGADLAAALNLDLEALEQVESDFPVNVPLPYLARIERGNSRDPLLLQVMTSVSELLPSGTTSPLQEEAFKLGFGLIQKYAGRVLVITTGSCAIHCRYCFRRHFPYADNQPSTEDWTKLFHQIEQDQSLSEVILSGGDPLMLNDRRLAWIAENLARIPHVTTLRLHTRMPVVVPQRVTSTLLDWMNKCSLNIVMVTHVNHGNEIDYEVKAAMKQLHRAGVTLLNQSVLLKDINDNAEALATLSNKLMDSGILPYYLHLMDPVLGASHFDVDETTGVALIAALRQSLPGYLVPRLSREVPFESSKQVIA